MSPGDAPILVVRVGSSEVGSAKTSWCSCFGKIEAVPVDQLPILAAALFLAFSGMAFF